jgi:hypothetical protein
MRGFNIYCNKVSQPSLDSFLESARRPAEYREVHDISDSQLIRRSPRSIGLFLLLNLFRVAIDNKTANPHPPLISSGSTIAYSSLLMDCCDGHQTHNHQLLKSLRESIVEPPYINGTLPLPDPFFSLFYKVARDGDAARFEYGDS